MLFPKHLLRVITTRRDELCDYCPTCKTLRDGKVHEATTVTPTANGRRSYRIVSSPISDENGKVTAAIEIVDDTTERVALEAKLRHSQQLESIGTLAGGIAHDFNNILSSVLGYTELALDVVGKKHHWRVIFRRYIQRASGQVSWLNKY